MTDTSTQASPDRESHSLWMGYALWLLGFLGAHRFYYGKKLTGILWMCTLGLLGIGWLFDLFWMPMLARSARRRYYDGPYSYDFAWLLQTYLGVLGLHRMYLGKWVSGVVWLLTGGLIGVGYIYDYLTLNEQVSLANEKAR
ncbi:MAG: TM2 domain-containing protein [Sandaracinaceae bacterium]|nr:TM2 domain-containing protein [Sandaracinaceae bacterium]